MSSQYPLSELAVYQGMASPEMCRRLDALQAERDTQASLVESCRALLLEAQLVLDDSDPEQFALSSKMRKWLYSSSTNSTGLGRRDRLQGTIASEG
ncbi:hypothetical protein HOP62_01580 [Halomonas sp. MCCC 1A17488]|uniref:hypothetical protein n=1 Tax=unclassified Halomonas TaxID=2609666 RepID=UPI0018D1FA9F|nr:MULTISPECIES: hypothetical protein [unclassified Halomonas]MCE8014765.1 hypothetical protein [Halomonas sp. MCCC 1A17488]MCG3238098.1 hypothetical protein [Halomonas sp. MCCC 1A17488]QPP48128.1 hypothetical protein I4484_12820 [Halomonas sp. SS10-MC5]